MLALPEGGDLQSQTAGLGWFPGFPGKIEELLQDINLPVSA